MGLVEIALMALCLNATCPVEKPTSFNNTMTEFVDLKKNSFKKRLRFNYLESELKGAHLKIATVQNGALSYAILENNTWVGKGAAFDLIEILQKKYEFNYTVVLPKENALGSNTSGIFGLLSSNQADLGAAFLPITTIYWQYAPFATTLDVGEWVIVLKRPRESATGSNLVAPFTLHVWILILISVLAVGPILYLINSMQRKICENEREKPISLVDCVWFVYGALLKQGTVFIPASDPPRLVFATWWIFITILTAFYTANLTAFLTLSEFTLPIRSARDVKVKKYPWVTIAGSVIEEASSNVYEELFHILRGSKAKFVEGNGSDILKTWVAERNYMYIAEKPNVDILLYEDYLAKIKSGVRESKRCTFVVTPWSLFKRPRTFAYSRSFRFGPLFDSALRTLVEVGIVKYTLQQKLPTVKICPLNLGSKERRLRNSDLLLTYYIVGVGFSIAIVIFMIEMFLKLLNWCKEKKKKTPRRKPKKSFGNALNFGQAVPPPPPYDALFFHPFKNSPKRQRRNINGRDYWVIKSEESGSTRLVPVRTPSALLFQYTN